MRAKKPGTCNYHQLGVWSVYVCTMLVCVQKGKGNERRGERSGSVCHKMSKNAAALENLFLYACVKLRIY